MALICINGWSIRMASAKDIFIKPIKASVANKKCAEIHYSGKVVPNSQLHFGVFLNDKLEGVMQFGPPINKKGTIIAYDDLPLLKKVKNKLPLIIGEKGNKLICEGNRYFDISKCGIGWHGDGERKKVIAFRLGVTLPLKFQWFHQNKPIGDVLDIKVENGDM